MHSTPRSRIRSTLSLLGLLLCLPLAAAAVDYTPEVQRATPFDIPDWFKTSFLDLKEDVAHANAANKRLLMYVGQEGCPYCRELMQNNFSQKPIVDLTRKHFDVLALNMWGDAEVTDFSGKHLTEKEFAKQLKVQFTPTLLFFDEQGNIVLRLNGYLPPHQFTAALQFVAGHKEKTTSFREYYASISPAPATGKLHLAPDMLQPPYKLTRTPASKPLMVLFEQKVCGECDVLHQKILTQDTSKALMKQLDVVLLDMWSATPVVTPDGRTRTASAWAQELGLVYAPGAVLFGPDGKEIIRIEGMLKAFHVQSVMDYAASGAYLKQPELQRFIEERAAALREKGVKVELW